MKHIYLFLFTNILFAIGSTSLAQEPIEKYNTFLRITEYYNAKGEKIGFSRVNARFSTIDYYDTSGKKIKSEPLPDNQNKESQKKTTPKKKLSKEDRALITPMHFEEIEGQRLIREPHPNLECIGYYNNNGELKAIRKYHRGTETWSVEWQ